MNESYSTSGESILRLSASLRALALDLARDPAEADDLLQEAWLTALETPRERIRDLSRWMRTVLRRGAARRRRRELLQRDRELVAARPDADADTDTDASTAEWSASAHRLIDAVAELDEPYRGVLRARYFDQRPVAEVARELGVPANTVKTWTRRGIERLRADLLRRSDGDRRAFGLFLAPLLGSRHPRPASALAPGVAALAPWIFAAAAFVLGLLWIARPDRGERPSTAVAPPSAERTEDLALLEPATPDLRRLPSALESGEEAPAPPAPPPADPTRRLSITVHDAARRPISGATVLLHATETEEIARASTGVDGRAELAVDPALLPAIPGIESAHPLVQVTAFAPGLAFSDVHYVPLPEGETKELDLPLAQPARRFSALLVDEYGEPVEGALARAQVPPVDFVTLPDGTRVGRYEQVAFSDADGRVRFDHLHPGTTGLEVMATDFVPLRIPLPETDDPLAGEETHALDRGAALLGELRYADGSPAAGATVRLVDLPRRQGAETSIEADERGGFFLRGIPPALCLVFASAPDDPELWAGTRVHGGREAETLWNATLERRPGVSVRVVDAAGEPLPGSTLYLGVMLEGALWIDLATSDAEGRARFLHVPDSVFQLRVVERDAAGTQRLLATASDLRPSVSEHVIRVASEERAEPASIEGVARLADAGPARGARLYAYHHETTGEHRAVADPETGRLALAAVLPGRYTLRVLFPLRGLVELAERELRPGESVDLGVVEEPEGVAVELAPWIRSPEEPTELQLLALYRAGGRVHRQELGALDLAAGARLRLVPGEYELGSAARTAPPAARFEVLAGEPLVLDLSAAADR